MEVTKCVEQRFATCGRSDMDMSLYIISIRNHLCGRMGRSVGTTDNSTGSGRLWVRSQVLANAKYGEFSSRETFHGFSFRHSINLGFSQHSFLANPCQINLVYYNSKNLYYVTAIGPVSLAVRLGVISDFRSPSIIARIFYRWNPYPENQVCV